MDLMRSMHTGFYRLRPFAIIVGFVIGATLTGCAAETRKSQALSRLDRIESELKRGVSTKADILFLLGEPSGSGGAMFPTASHANEVWYYEASGASLTSLELKILLIYFNRDTYDGFMWFSNDADLHFE